MLSSQLGDDVKDLFWKVHTGRLVALGEMGLARRGREGYWWLFWPGKI